ncbi:hypothetical protein TUBRATIS_23190 [Tubulinosema ratisbonensis]|uniref:Ricin B lectin domain-containing protein n=1 Tax=Tubulinosema ratisbonensis TaxID=291195 RepID=A0A437AJC1_9MICR|nr:hypothetical protein TUBRATIS_23190 [Tubulinosema ratisbonensis]
MLFWFFIIKCDIPVGSPVHIVPEYDGSLQFSYDEGVVRLKAEDRNYPGFREENVAILRLYEGKYEITMQGFGLCHCPDNNEIVGCTEHEEYNLKSLYDIITTEKGYMIKQDGNCLVKGEYDPFFKGYIIRMKICNNGDDEIWKFEDVELNEDEEDQARMSIESSKRRLAYFSGHKTISKNDHPEVVGRNFFGFGTFRHTTDPTKLSHIQ